MDATQGRWQLLEPILSELEYSLSGDQLPKLAEWRNRLREPTAPLIGLPGELGLGIRQMLFYETLHTILEGRLEFLGRLGNNDGAPGGAPRPDYGVVIDDFFLDGLKGCLGEDQKEVLQAFRARLKLERSLFENDGGGQGESNNDWPAIEAEEEYGPFLEHARTSANLDSDPFLMVDGVSKIMEDEYGPHWTEDAEARERAMWELKAVFREDQLEKVITLLKESSNSPKGNDLRLVVLAARRVRLSKSQSKVLTAIRREAEERAKKHLTDIARRNIAAEQARKRRPIRNPYKAPELVQLAQDVRKRILHMLDPGQKMEFDSQLKRLERQQRLRPLLGDQTRDQGRAHEDAEQGGQNRS